MRGRPAPYPHGRALSPNERDSDGSWPAVNPETYVFVAAATAKQADDGIRGGRIIMIGVLPIAIRWKTAPPSSGRAGEAECLRSAAEFEVINQIGKV